jgi:hypothetical protein
VGVKGNDDREAPKPPSRPRYRGTESAVCRLRRTWSALARSQVPKRIAREPPRAILFVKRAKHDTGISALGRAIVTLDGIGQAAGLFLLIVGVALQVDAVSRPHRLHSRRARPR